MLVQHSGMTHPDKVLSFLNFTGAWDPSLAFVMAGGLAGSAVSYRVARRLHAPFLAKKFLLPDKCARSSSCLPSMQRSAGS
jgi:hypothetical protein